MRILLCVLDRFLFSFKSELLQVVPLFCPTFGVDSKKGKGYGFLKYAILMHMKGKKKDILILVLLIIMMAAAYIFV